MLILCMGVILCIMLQCQRNLTCVAISKLKIVHVIPSLQESTRTLAPFRLVARSMIWHEWWRVWLWLHYITYYWIHRFVGPSSNIICIGWVRHTSVEDIICWAHFNILILFFVGSKTRYKCFVFIVALHIVALFSIYRHM